MRLFIAINLPDSLKKTISQVEDRVRIRGDFVRWIDPGNIHLTLKFLGEVAPSLLDDIGDILVRTVSPHAAFDMSVEGIGAFPNLRKPRVVWLGIWGGDSLQAICSELNDGLAPLGFEKETRPFRPHLTIGRVRMGRVGGGKRGAPIEERIRDLHVEASAFRVSSVELMESFLEPTGAVYQARISAPLREPSP